MNDDAKIVLIIIAAVWVISSWDTEPYPPTETREYSYSKQHEVDHDTDETLHLYYSTHMDPTP